MPKYVIIGNSAGGIGAAGAIREADRKGSLAIISDEPHPAYSRPLISKYVTGERTLEEMLLHPADFYEKNGVELRLGQKARSLDLEKRVVELETGQSVPWERLLLATGGKPIIPALEGLENRNIFTFTSLSEAQELAQALPAAWRVVVIGGGLIGMAVTEALVKRGLKVMVVEMVDRVLSAILDEPASRLVEKRLKEQGVELCTGRTVKKIVGRGGSVAGVVLSDGETVSADLVVIAIGVTPRTDLVTGTPIRVNRGIVVDKHMATSVPGIYACGDVAEAYDYIREAPGLTPIWPSAYMGGRIAGYNMAGRQTPYPGATMANSLDYFGLPVVSAGLVNPPAEDGYEIMTATNGSTYKKVVLRGSTVAGLVFVGDIQRAGILFGLMRDRIPVVGFKEALLAPDFGLSYLPQEVRQSRLASDYVFSRGGNHERPD